MGRIIGIDLGTTTSEISYMEIHQKKNYFLLSERKNSQ